MKLRAVLTVCVAVGSLKLASSAAMPPNGEDRPPNYREPQQPNVPPKLTFATDPSLLLKALPAAVAAFVDALTALASNHATPSPSVTRVSTEPATVTLEPSAQRYAVFPNFRIAMPWYAMFLRRGFASQWPPVVVRQSFATPASEPEVRVSRISNTANTAEPEQPVSREQETAVRHSAIDLPIIEQDSVVTSAPDVSLPDSTTVAAVLDHVAVTEKPSDIRPREYSIVFSTTPFSDSVFKKPHKRPKSVPKSFKYSDENEIPFTE